MWYYIRDGERQGPLSEDQMKEMAGSGALQPADLVWQDGMQDWLPASQVGIFEFAGAAPAAPAVPAPPPPGMGAPAPQAAYQQPQQPYQQPQGGAEITNYLPWAIVVTLLCCLPAGIASIVYAVKANNAKGAGDMVAAEAAAKNAKTWIIVSVVAGLLAIIINILIVVASEM